MNIKEWLTTATKELADAGIPSARLDAELILGHTLRKPRTYLHAHDDELIDDRREDIANARIQMRLDHTPIAYIIGHKEFYGRRFKTTPAALIPRPESEAIIEILADIMPKNLQLIPEKISLVDIGTGTGCLGITAKMEWPELDVTLIDNDTHALNLSRLNANIHGVDVQFRKNNLLRGYMAPTDIIVANLPYVDRDWDVSPETNAEPPQALYANNEGLSLIYKLIDQSSAILKTGGHLLLESDIRQQSKIIEYTTRHGFKHQETRGLITYFIQT